MESNQVKLQNKKVKCEAVGVRFISGIASRYDDTYPVELNGYITGKNSLSFHFKLIN